MDNAHLLGSIMGPAYLIFGLSFLMYGKEWTKLIKKWEEDHFSMVIGMMLSLILGLTIINMYNEWTKSIWLIITLTGWAGFVKGLVYFLAPGKWTKKIIKKFNNVTWLYAGGVVLCIFGVWLEYAVFPI